MEIKKIVVFSLALVFSATAAIADTRPEFDAVGCDANNIFSQGLREQMVKANAVYDPTDPTPLLINEYSA